MGAGNSTRRFVLMRKALPSLSMKFGLYATVCSNPSGDAERYNRIPKIPKSLGSILKPGRSPGELRDGTPMARPTPPTPELSVRVPG